MRRTWLESKITKDIIKRKLYIKNELNKIILKSFIQNKNINPLKRSYCLFLITIKHKNKKSISQQQNNCVLSGKSKSNFKISSMSRQNTKKLIDLGLMQNIKTFN